MPETDRFFLSSRILVGATAGWLRAGAAALGIALGATACAGVSHPGVDPARPARVETPATDGSAVAGIAAPAVSAAAAPVAPASVEPIAGTDGSWLAQAQRSIERREYWASPNGDGLQAPNRAHNLRTYFDQDGIRLHDRTAAGSPELLRLSLADVGRVGAMGPVSKGEVVSDGGRVEIRRPGLVEWYENSQAGLEQGFTFAERPEGKGELVLELELEGARATLRGDRVILAAGNGRRLAYGKLVAVDAAGQEVVARFEVADASRLRLVVDDARAEYPLVIDPLLTATADSQLESDQAGASLGYSVAGAGDVNGDGYADVIVGARFYDAGETNEGAAFVFHGSAAGIVAAGNPGDAASQLESNQASAQLGSSVAGAGDVNGDGYADVIVGAPFYDAGESDEGAAFVFLGSASGILAAGHPGNAASQLESDQAGAWLGWSVAGAGDVNGDGYADVIVGARLYDAGETNEGAAFVFHGSAAGIVAAGNPGDAASQLESNQASASLGWSVAGAGDVNGDGYADVIVGALSYDAGETDEGAAFVFLGSASGILAAGHSGNAASQLESDQAGASLGYSVAGAGDVNGDGYADVIVGARFYDAGETNEGAAFVFHGSAAGIVAAGNPGDAASQLESNQASAWLGWSVAGAGDVNGDGYADVIVGALSYDAGETDEGAAFVFLGSASGILAAGHPGNAASQLESDQAGAQLGSSVAGAGDVNGDGYADVIVGARFYDAGETDEGAAFVFLGSASGLMATGNPSNASSQLESNQIEAEFGLGVAGAGDVNGDGYADVIVGATKYDAGQVNEGAAFVFHGGASGIANGSPATAATQLESDHVGSYFGETVAGAGDVNGDGYADVIVGARRYDLGSDLSTNEGAAFVFLGGAGGVGDGNPTTAGASLLGDQLNGEFGASVAGAGDVNGDGYADVIVGAGLYDSPEADEGVAFVFHGSSGGIADGGASTADSQLESDQVSAQLGMSVAGAGDVNGDGYADVIAGAWIYDSGETNEGAAFVFHGSAAGIVAAGNPSDAASQLESNQANAFLGGSVAGAGDVNGDGYADVIVGAHFFDAGESDEGAVFVFHGGSSGVVDFGDPSNAASQLESDAANAWFGQSVAGAGDINGDGYADVIVGAPSYYFGSGLLYGVAFIFHGDEAGIADGNPATAAAQLVSDQDFTEIGSVAGAGDVNGDGYADVIIGMAEYDSPQLTEGAAFIFLGNGGANGRSVLARQLGVGMAPVPPIAAWGRSNSPDEIQIAMNATHPEGRGRVKLDIETCPPGVAFEDGSCLGWVSTSWTDVTATSTGVTLTETVPIPFGSTLIRWRARVLYAPLSVTQAGITAAPNPSHGPWRRLSGQANEGDVRRQLDDAVAVPGGTNVSEALLGGPPSWGGIDVTFADVGGGNLSGSFTPVPANASLSEVIDDPGEINFLLPSDPVQLWDVSFDGPFTGLVTLTFQYDDTNLLLPETDLFIGHYTGGMWETLPVVSRNTVANTITVTTTSLSPFVLAGPVSTSIAWDFSGTAVGGSIDFTLGAVFLSVTTTAGQTAVEVAAAVAAAINGDATLSAAGITASADATSVTTNGSVTSYTVADAGLTAELQYPPPPQVPALGDIGIALLVVSLLGSGLVLVARQRRRDQRGQSFE